MEKSPSSSGLEGEPKSDGFPANKARYASLILGGLLLFSGGMGVGYVIGSSSPSSSSEQNNASLRSSVCDCSSCNEGPTAAPTVTPVQAPVSAPSVSPVSVVNNNGGGEWAFLETFDGDPASPSQDLLPRTMEYVVTHRTHPQEHFTKEFPLYPADHDDACAGPDPRVSPLPQHMVRTSQNSAMGRIDQSFFLCKNHMMSSMGDVIPYSVSAFWPRQEFRFANDNNNNGEAADKGGVLEFDVNINDGHTVRSWWEILITPRDELKVGAGPLDSPISETYPNSRIVLDFRRNVRSIRVGAGALAPDGWMAEDVQLGEWDYAWWNNLHPDDPASTDRRIRRRMRIQFLQNRINWGIETQDGSFDEWGTDIPGGGLPFDQGLVVFKTHAYTPTKDQNMDTYTFHWDNIAFNGPVLGKYDTFHADDVVYLQRNGDRQIGDSQEVAIDIPRAVTQESMPVLFGQLHQPKKGQVLVSINGGPDIAVEPFDYDEDTPGCSSEHWVSFRLELQPSQLQQGRNTFLWTVGPRPACAQGWVWDGFSVKYLHVQMEEAG